MKKKTTTFAILLGLLFILLTGTFLIGFLSLSAKADGEDEKEVDITMFSAYTTCDVFQTVPVMETVSGKFDDAEDYGDQNYVINVSGTTVEEYQAYLKTLEDAGFKKHSDNGEDAMGGYALTAAYTKGNITLVVSQAINQAHTYICASYDLALSDYMIYDKEAAKKADVKEKTKVHMLELHDNGNSFIIELKNGHFVVHDGGQAIDAPYLLDYLEELTQGAEKPVIEAWFISHAHSDHVGAIVEIAKDEREASRVCVEGIYYTEPSAKAFQLLSMGDGTQTNWTTKRVNYAYKTQSGDTTPMYRMMFGQRYYFCDLTIDVALTIEQFPIESYYSTDFNDTSTWLLHHIEGQRFLHAGDTHHTGMRVAMQIFDQSWFEFDVLATFHHGINIHEYFTSYCTLKTVLYTSFRESSIWEPSRTELARVEDNNHLKASCLEYVSHGNGTVVLTFPYNVGEYEIMEPFKWQYDGGVKRTTIRE